MQSMLWRWVSPAQTITTDMDDVTQHFAIINTSGPTGRWEQVLDALVS